MASRSVELMKLRRLLLTMSAEVEQRVCEAFEGFLKHDLRQAEHVRDTDDLIDQLDVDIEKECATILALHQPVAGDLRYVMAALRINADLERIADLARGIAKRAIKLEYVKPVDRPPALSTMAQRIRDMLSDSLRSLADMDADLAYRVRGSDKAVDQLHKETMAWAAQQIALGMENPKGFLDLVTIMRSMERIADLASNIAESVVFAVEGAIVRHKRLEPSGTPGSIP